MQIGLNQKSNFCERNIITFQQCPICCPPSWISVQIKCRYIIENDQRSIQAKIEFKRFSGFRLHIFYSVFSPIDFLFNLSYSGEYLNNITIDNFIRKHPIIIYVHFWVLLCLQFLRESFYLFYHRLLILKTKSCNGSHLGFLIRNANFVRENPVTIHIQFVFNMLICKNCSF